jgi:SNF2 family DNA or RNA helicase
MLYLEEVPELRPYQRTGQNFLLAKPRAILGDAPGSGKTPVALASLAAVGAERALIVCPNNVVHHWKELAAQWWPAVWIWDGRGTRQARADARLDIWAGGQNRRVALVINYEAMRIDVEELLKIGWDTVIFDEMHRLKNRRALQTRAAWKLAAKVPRVWGLTGTPIPNRPDEAWSLLHMLYPRYWPSYWRWVNQHCVVDLARFGGRAPVKVVVGLRPGSVTHIRAELAPVLLQRSLEELLPDLPPVTTTVLEVDLDATERKAYDDLKRRHWTQLEDGTLIQTVNEVSRLTRFRQIVSDMEALGATRARPGTKIAATLELISDLEPEQVVVLTWSRAAAERVADEAGGAYVHGGLAGPDRQAALEAFKEGKVRVLAGTLATLGEGVDGLQVARHVVLLDRPWRPSDEEQAIGRIRRSGQVDAVFAWMVTARDTVDVKINKMLAQKRSVIDALRVGEIEP